MGKFALVIGVCCITNAFYLGIESQDDKEPAFCVFIAFLSFIIGMLYLIIWKEENDKPTP